MKNLYWINVKYHINSVANFYLKLFKTFYFIKYIDELHVWI